MKTKKQPLAVFAVALKGKTRWHFELNVDAEPSVYSSRADAVLHARWLRSYGYVDRGSAKVVKLSGVV
jgi:hypothetical protein